MSSFPLPDGIKTYHTKPYPAIDVSRRELSSAGKVVVVTGGGSGLGLAFAQHFAKAGCTQLVITGRRLPVLHEAQSIIQAAHPDTTVLPLQGDVASATDVDAQFLKIKGEFGRVDVLINNAGYLPEYEQIGGHDENAEDWWRAFETNIRGSHNILRAFVRIAATNATVINLTSAAANAITPTQSAYSAAKLAGVRLFEVFQAEHPEYRVVNVAPGIVLTSMHEKTIAAFKARGWPELPLDEIELPASYLVWASSPEAEFIKGRFVWVHWDVFELKQVLQKNGGDASFLRSGIHGMQNLGSG